jgi:hypothetical protein
MSRPISRPISPTLNKHLKFWFLLSLGLMLSCAPTTSPTVQSIGPSKLLGSWQGKDPYDQSNITFNIALTASRYQVTATDDKTTSDWCGVSATASATSDLEANQTLVVNLVWVCNNPSKTKQTFPTILSYNASSDSMTAYGTTFVRIK